MGVSTNTLYKYLEEGSIKSRRIGQGRFKIPATELEAYVDTSGDQEAISGRVEEVGTQDKIYSTNRTDMAEVLEVRKPIGGFGEEKIQNGKAKEESQAEDIRSGVSDIVFFRIFKAVTFLGLGFIYLFSSSELLSVELDILDVSNQLFLRFLTGGLLIVGIFNVLEAVKPKRFEASHLFFDAVSIVVLAIYSFLAITSAQWGLFVFAVSFTGISLNHLISGVKGLRPGENLSSEGYAPQFSFFDAFSRYCLLLAIIGGIVIIMFPHTFPIQNVTQYIKDNTSIFAFIWFSMLAIPTIYVLSPKGRVSPFRLPFFVLGSTLAIIVAINLTFIASWDIAYFSFLTGIFGFFLGWWSDEERALAGGKIWVVFLVFMWISSTIVFGLFSLNISRNEILLGVRSSLEESTEKIIENINDNFTQKASVLTHYAGRPEVKDILLNDSASDISTTLARQIYDQLEGIQRVLVYNKDGIALGVYPRNTIFQGTNFSSQDYFQETLKTYRPFVSPLFENIVGEPVIIQTEPVFVSNQFIGMIALSYDLKNFADFIGVGANYSYLIRGVDSKGFVVFSSDASQVGGRHIYNTSELESEKFVSTTQQADIPEWSVYLTTEVAPAVQRISSLNITLSILLTVNALFSITAGVIAAKRKENTSQLTDASQNLNLAQNPRFI